MKQVYMIGEFDGNRVKGESVAFDQFYQAVSQAKKRGWKVLAMPLEVDLRDVPRETFEKHSFDPSAFFWTDDEVKAIGS